MVLSDRTIGTQTTGTQTEREEVLSEHCDTFSYCEGDPELTQVAQIVLTWSWAMCSEIDSPTK